MYVYFDNLGEIKSIAPAEINNEESLEFAIFPLADVEDFLTGKKSTLDFRITQVDDELNIVKKEKAAYVPTANTFLNEILINENPDVVIENDIFNKCLTISLSPTFNKSASSPGSKLKTFARTPSVLLMFTKKHDPHFLIHSITFSPTMLVNAGVVKIKYEPDLTSASLFAEKIIDGYSYIIKETNGI